MNVKHCRVCDEVHVQHTQACECIHRRKLCVFNAHRIEVIYFC